VVQLFAETTISYGQTGHLWQLSTFDANGCFAHIKWCLQRKADDVFIRRPIFTEATNKRSAHMQSRSGHGLARSGWGAISIAKDSGAPAEQMILKFERLTQKQQAMLLTLADELPLTVRGKCMTIRFKSKLITVIVID
jgi:hypothetical protein